MSETFDLMAFFDGSTYPTKEVTVYRDVAAMAKREEIDALIQGVDNSGKPLPPAQLLSVKALEEKEAELEELNTKISSSGVTFTLQGMPFEVAKGVVDIFDSETDPSDDDVLELIHLTISGVQDTKGAKGSVPTVENLKAIRNRVSPREFNKLVHATFEVNYSAATYEESIDAGFHGGGDDVA